MKTQYLLILSTIFLLCSFVFIKEPEVLRLKYTQKKHTKVPEPSDIVFDKESNVYYIPSDNGILFKCDADGNILQKAEIVGWDFEGVEIKGNSVFVSDESARKVYKYNKSDLSLENTYSYIYTGGRNEGVESITYNETKKCFVLISEKNPVTILECNDNFQIINQVNFEAARDVSSARYHNGHMYLLSDEDRSVLKCDPTSYKVLQKYSINVINPEGICFDANNNLIIAGDDIQYIYLFGPLN